MPQGNPRPGEIYLHFKQKMYQIVTIAQHSETKEKLVIYQALYGEFKTYARPYEMFISPVDKEKYPEVEQKYRFQLVEPQSVEMERADCPKVADSLVKAGSSGRAESTVTVQKTAAMTPEEKLMAFLDAETREEKYKILLEMRECITDHMINNMAVVMDLVIEDGPIEKRYEELKQCLRTMQKYESTRLR